MQTLIRPNLSPPIPRRTTRRRVRRPPRWRRPCLRLSPYAWAKLLFLRDRGETEVGAFGVSRRSDLLLVADLQLVSQACSVVTVKFDDQAVADYFDCQVDAGRQPEEFGRIWIHTHPGDSPEPSATDEDTFSRCFGGADWAVMLIVARGDQTYARLRYGRGLGGEVRLPVEIDFRESFPAADPAAWAAEYQHHVAVADDVSCQPQPASLDDRIRTWGEYDALGLGATWLESCQLGQHPDLVQELSHAEF